MAQRLEAWWWRFYLRRQPVEEYLAWKRRYWHLLLEKTGVQADPHHRILDAGCGPAGIFLLFPAQEVVAVDPLVEVYRRRLSRLSGHWSANTDFVACALETFRPNRPFDLVFCLNAINHVADPDVCLANLRQATASGGHLILTVDAHHHAFLEALFRLVPGDVLHPQQWSLAGYLRKLEMAGFVPVKTARLKQGAIFDYFLVVAKPAEQ